MRASRCRPVMHSLHDALPILARPGVEARPAPQFRLVRKIKGQALVHLHLREVARARATSRRDRKSTRLNSSHRTISYAVFCLKKKTRFRISLEADPSASIGAT